MRGIVTNGDTIERQAENPTTHGEEQDDPPSATGERPMLFPEALEGGGKQPPGSSRKGDMPGDGVLREQRRAREVRDRERSINTALEKVNGIFTLVSRYSSGHKGDDVDDDGDDGDDDDDNGDDGDDGDDNDNVDVPLGTVSTLYPTAFLEVTRASTNYCGLPTSMMICHILVRNDNTSDTIYRASRLCWRSDACVDMFPTNVFS